jgi:hypothetical protein
MYKSIKEFDGQISGIKRLSDRACIPFAPDNVDYQEFVQWCEQGNTPLPADEVDNAV